MFENEYIETIDELSKKNRELEDKVRDLRVLANLASVIAWLEADADKRFQEGKRIEKKAAELTSLCKKQEVEIERLKSSGHKWSEEAAEA
jgi:hypothetical protein